MSNERGESDTAPAFIIPESTMRRRLLIGAAIVLLLALLGGAITLMVILLRGDQSASGPLATPLSSPSQSPATSPSTVPPASSAERRPTDSLAVVIKYVRSDTFSLSLESIHRTYEIPTVDVIQPRSGQPYSILEIRDQQQRLLAEHRFTMPTTILLESAAQAGNPLYPLPESKLTMVLPAPSTGTPATIRLVTPTKQVLAEEAFVYEALPIDTPPPSPLSRLWQRLQLLVTTPVWAADNRLTLVVINEVGAQNALTRAQQQTTGMRDAIEPWKTYQQNTDIQVVTNTQSLDCILITANGLQYPACPDEGRVAQVVQALGVAEWDAIAVVVDTEGQCDCGTNTRFGNRIVAISTDITSGVIAHEFGHGLPGLADEYYYQFNGNGTAGPNCYPSQSACQTAIDPYSGDPAAVCAAGCNNASTWRPSSRLMHNTYSQLIYGPVEECYMGRAIAEILGQEHDCGQSTTSPSPSPDVPTPRPNNYWGGGR